MQNENTYLSIGQAAKILGVSVVTLRRWEKLGHLLSSFRTFGEHRRYDIHALYYRYYNIILIKNVAFISEVLASHC